MKKLILSVSCLVFALSAAMVFIGCQTDGGNTGSASGEGGHTHAFVEQKIDQAYLSSPATCTERAMYYFSCACGEKGIGSFYYGNALGHEYGDWLVITPATSESEGLQRRTCSRCSEKEEQSIPKIVHVHAYSDAVVAPTCTEGGYTLHSCACGDTFKDTFTKALNHSFTDYVSDNNATCEQDGTKTAKCDRCEVTDTIADVGSKKEHSFSRQEVTEEYLKSAATCTEKAIYYYSCSACGEKGEEAFETGSPLGHNYGDWVVVTPATEETEGLKERVCSRCNDKETQNIPQIGHIHAYSETVINPTCTETGYTLHQCRCGDSYKDKYENALGHIFTNYVSDGNATCTQDGTKTAVCDRCDTTKTITDIGSKTSHNYNKQVVAEEYFNTAATCAQKATYFYSCVCGEKGTETFESGAPLGHDIIQHSAQAATCTEIGWESYATCTRCDYTTYVKIPALGHTPSSEWNVTQLLTCVQDGRQERCCVVCNQVIDEEVTRALGHNLETVAAKAPTCTEIGWNEYQQCTRCDYTFFIEIPALGHIPSLEWNVTQLLTCVQDGKQEKCCVVCNQVIDEKVTRALGHNFNDGTCIRCGEIDPDYKEPTDGLQYTLNLDCASYSCTGIGTATATNIVIAKKYKGLPVTRIGNRAFYNCDNLISVDIPDSVTSIGEWAFCGCNAITSITIPTSVIAIGESAFSNCYKLIEIINNSMLNIKKGSEENGYLGYYALNVKNEGVTDIVNKDEYLFYQYNKVNYLLGYIGTQIELSLPRCYNGQEYEIYDYAFYCCVNLTGIVISDSVVSIGRFAFYGCSGLTSVNVPGSVISIGDLAFNNCSGLTSVSISDGVISIGRFAFSSCRELVNITIGDSVTSIGQRAFADCVKAVNIIIGNSVVYIDDYAFYNCSGLVSVTIPDSITSIGRAAFKDCIGIAKVMMGNGVISIGDYAFNNCSGLTSINIPNSVTSIGHGAFSYCSGLKAIGFKGTVAEWNAISKVYDWKNGVPLDCKVKCTDGTISI